MHFYVKDIEETTNLGFSIGKLLKSGDIVCLTGDLGTGKTHITKGIAKGLEIDDHITSPTFYYSKWIWLRKIKVISFWRL